MRVGHKKKTALLTLIGVILSIIISISLVTGCVRDNKSEAQSESNKTTFEENIEKADEVKDSTGNGDPIEDLTVKETTSQEAIGKKENLFLEVFPLDVFPLEFVFSSGAGAWRTTLTLNSDGSFEGAYLDSDMGTRGDDYQYGTVYISKFHGQFDDIQQLNEYAYSMILSEIITENEENQEWIENEIRYVASDPYGLEDGKEFLFYTPGTPFDQLSKEFLSWRPYNDSPSEEPMKALSCFGIYNKNMEYGFFTND